MGRIQSAGFERVALVAELPEDTYAIEAAYSAKPVVLSICFICVDSNNDWPAFSDEAAPTAQPLVIIDVVKLAPDTNLSAQSGKAQVSPEPEQEATSRKPPLHLHLRPLHHHCQLIM